MYAVYICILKDEGQIGNKGRNLKNEEAKKGS